MKNIGDLSRLSYQLQYSQHKIRENTINTPKFHKIFNGEKSLDLITIGDSFSSGGGGGKGSYYQDFIANEYKIKIANVSIVKDVRSTFKMVIQDEFLEKYKPKIILLQSVQREFLNRFEKEFDKKEYDINYIDNFLLDGKIESLGEKEKKEFQFISNLNFKAILFDLLYVFSENAFFSKVFIVYLKDKYFENKNGNKLLFFHKDLKNHEDKNCRRSIKVIQNLNYYAKKMKTYNTKLILLIAPDKFHIYQNYLKRKKTYNNKIFECFRKNELDFKFIDSDILLENAIKNGTKEIYHFDDTHWTWKASEILFSNSSFLKNQND